MSTLRVSLPVDRIDTARNCLALISAIAARGASSPDPEHVGYALEELTQVLFERTGSQEGSSQYLRIGSAMFLHCLLNWNSWIRFRKDSIGGSWFDATTTTKPQFRAIPIRICTWRARLRV